MTEIAGAPLADTSDMVGLHKVFRNAFTSAVGLVGSVEADDRDRVDMVATYYDNVLRLLHSHHESEDALLTPRLVQRCTAAEAEQVERVAAQHKSVIAAIEAAEALLAQWRAAPDVDTAAALSTGLVTLGAELAEHLDDEERVVLPIAARHITAPEWGEMPAHGMRTFTGDKLWLVIGLIREQMTAEQLAMMDTMMPPPVAQFWVDQGQGMYLEFVTALRA